MVVVGKAAAVRAAADDAVGLVGGVVDVDIGGVVGGAMGWDASM